MAEWIYFMNPPRRDFAATLASDDYTHKVTCKIAASNSGGTAKVGYKPTAAHCTWSPAVTPHTYQWKRNDTAISGATKSTYVPSGPTWARRSQ
ncbi:hypothetical protein GCM10011579_006550 [Streptomyces albiflavescens]|uniref:Ig-like domain-containing protein n=1 Tax=Streptomyces albiflavescens TaxID=1623582 RepID=A0A918CZ93_9ACTN|nr:hypothetical protein [Streptomyces albiflavescens]GGN51111.1 hypothetical protein GCM10011579_006550 [Streptomyces albiflavescens]